MYSDDIVACIQALAPFPKAEPEPEWPPTCTPQDLEDASTVRCDLLVPEPLPPSGIGILDVSTHYKRVRLKGTMKEKVHKLLAKKGPTTIDDIVKECGITWKQVLKIVSGGRMSKEFMTLEPRGTFVKKHYFLAKDKDKYLGENGENNEKEIA